MLHPNLDSWDLFSRYFLYFVVPVGLVALAIGITKLILFARRSRSRKR